MAFTRYRLHADSRQRNRQRSTLRNGGNDTSAANSGNHQHSYHSGNLTRHLTGGLQQLYQRMIAAQKQEEASRPVVTNESFTRADGHLILSEQLPLLNNRYRVLSTLGEGTFSQLILAEDTFTPLPTSAAQHNAQRNNNNNNHHTNKNANTSNHTHPTLMPSLPQHAANGYKRVAIKIMNSKYTFIGLQEVEKLCWLNGKDIRHESHILRLLGAFYFTAHLCLVMELCGQSLLSYMKAQPNHRVSIEIIRKIAFQLCISLAFVGSCNMIHGDIKPENVLLTQPLPSSQPTSTNDMSNNNNNNNVNNNNIQNSNNDRTNIDSSTNNNISSSSSSIPLSTTTSNSSHSANIKLIDFGNAMTGNEASLYYDDFDVQTLYYRAPEVLLGVSFNCAIDMWSLGCVLMELATGKPLFHCTSNKELFIAMIKCLGPMPILPFLNGKFVKKYFTHPSYTYTPSPVTSPSAQTSQLISSSLQATQSYSQSFTSHTPPVSQTDTSHYHYLARLNSISKALHSRDRDFVSFLCGLLEYDPQQRLTPLQALFHPFFGKLTPLSLILGHPNDCLPAQQSVYKLNTKTVAAQPQQQQSQHAQQHPQPVQQQAQVQLPQYSHAPLMQQSALSNIDPASVATYNYNTLRPPYSSSHMNRTTIQTSPMSMGTYPASPMTSPTLHVAPLHSSPYASSPPSSDSPSFVVHHRRLHDPMSGHPQSQNAQAPPQHPILDYRTQSLYYPQPLSSFSYAHTQPSTPILAARPPPAMTKRFPQSPDMHSHSLNLNAATASPLSAHNAYSNYYVPVSNAPAYSSPYNSVAMPSSANAVAMYNSAPTTQQQLQLQAQQAALVQSSLLDYPTQPTSQSRSYVYSVTPSSSHRAIVTPPYSSAMQQQAMQTAVYAPYTSASPTYHTSATSQSPPSFARPILLTDNSHESFNGRKRKSSNGGATQKRRDLRNDDSNNTATSIDGFDTSNNDSGHPTVLTAIPPTTLARINDSYKHEPR